MKVSNWRGIDVSRSKNRTCLMSASSPLAADAIMSSESCHRNKSWIFVVPIVF